MLDETRPVRTIFAAVVVLFSVFGILACGGSDTVDPADSGVDSGFDSRTDDTGTDSTVDASLDVGADVVASDTTPGTFVDSAFDAGIDADASDAADASDSADATASVDADAAVGTVDAGPGTDASTTGGTWRAVRAPMFAPAMGSALLLTDGTVMVHTAVGRARWMRLTPDIDGNYARGTWSQMASLPDGYTPLYFASAVLPDGRVLIEGGEYNDGAPIAETNLGAIYDPKLDTWTPVDPPTGWLSIGDAPSIVLPNGVFMMGNAVTRQQALFDAQTLTWTTTGTGKADRNNEEGWTLLPDGRVLTVDTTNGTNSEIYDPSTGSWTSAGSTVADLIAGQEVGPTITMANGRVLALGATGATAIYGVGGPWTAGPDLPVARGEQLTSADGPAVLLPNGNVLVVLSPGIYSTPASYFEFDGVRFNPVASAPNAVNESSYTVSFLLLPTGEVLVVDQSSRLELYTPTGAPDPAWAPTIANVPSMVARSSTYAISGTQFNGLSQGAAYGDDVQSATNYPLVRITNDATGHVFYARTHDHSTMAIATGSQPVSTSFDVPANAETGASHIVVVANGIASAPVVVTVQ